MGNLGMELVLCPGPSPTWILSRTCFLSRRGGFLTKRTRQKPIDLSLLTGDEGAPWLQILWYLSLKARGVVRTSHGIEGPSMVDWGAHPPIRQRTSSISDLHTYVILTGLLGSFQKVKVISLFLQEGLIVHLELCWGKDFIFILKLARKSSVL